MPGSHTSTIDPPHSPLPCSLGGFCPYLLNIKLFPKCVLIMKLFFRLNRMKEVWSKRHGRLPACCHLPTGSSGAVLSSAERGAGRSHCPHWHPAAETARKHCGHAKSRVEVSGQLQQISRCNACTLNLNTDGWSLQWVWGSWGFFFREEMECRVVE